MKKNQGLSAWVLGAWAGALLLAGVSRGPAWAQALPDAAEIKPTAPESMVERTFVPDRVPLKFLVPTGSRLLVARSSFGVVGFREWNSDGKVVVFDVATNRQIALSSKGVPSYASYQTRMMLSNDGTRLVAWDEGYSDYSENSVDATVWNIKSAQLVGQVLFSKVGRADFIDFYGKEKMIFYTVNSSSSRKRVGKIEFWDYKEKSLIEALPVDFEGTQGLVVDTKRDRLWVANVLRDDAGRMEVSGIDLQSYQPTKDKLSLTGVKKVVGMAVSPDFNKLGVMFESSNTSGWSTRYKVCIFDLENNSSVVSKEALSSSQYAMSYDRNSRIVQTGPANLQWSGNSKWLLLGRNSIVDAQTAAEAGLVTDMMEFNREQRYGFGNMLIGPDSIMKVVSQNPAPRYGESLMVITGFRLPVTQLAKGVEEATTRPSAEERSAAGEGGSRTGQAWSSATVYPMLSKVDPESVVKGHAELVVPNELPKTVTPNPGPGVEGTGAPSRTIDLSALRPEQIYSNGWSAELGVTHGLRGVAVTSGVNSRYAALSGRLDYRGNSGEYCMGLVVDLAEARPVYAFTIPKGGVIGAIAPDGKRVAVYTSIGSEVRIDVYDLAQGSTTPKHVVGWTAGWTRPLAFVDSDRLLVGNSLQGAGVSCYRLSSLALEYSVPGSCWTLSPGRTQLFIAHKGQLLCLDSDTGKPLARLDANLMPDENFMNEVTGMALDPSGNRLCFMVSRKNGGNLLQLIDLKTGRRIAQHNYFSTFDKTWGTIQSVGTSYFLLGGRVLVEAPDMVPVGFLKSPLPVVFYGDEAWNFADSMGHWRRTAFGTAFNPAQVKGPVGVRRLDDLVVFRTPASVRVELGERPAMDDISPVEKALMESLENKSITVKPDAEVTLRIDTPTKKETWQPGGTQMQKQEDGSMKPVPLQVESLYFDPEVTLMRAGKVLAVSQGLPKAQQDSVVITPDMDAEKKKRITREAYQGAIIKTVWRTVPAVLMDYNKLTEFTPWPDAPLKETNTSNPWVVAAQSDTRTTTSSDSSTSGSRTPSEPAPVELSYDQMRVELKALKAYKVIADDWAKDSDEMVSGASSRFDARKFRMQCDDLAVGLRKLAPPAEKISEPMTKSIGKVKESAGLMSKYYQQAMTAFAARVANRPSADPNGFMYQAKTTYDKDFKPAMEAINARITELEGKIR